MRVNISEILNLFPESERWMRAFEVGIESQHCAILQEVVSTLEFTSSFTPVKDTISAQSAFILNDSLKIFDCESVIVVI